MPTQFDHRIRVVSLDNLRAICERISGMAHRYNVSKVSRSRVHVEYSNPDEYGHAHPVTAIYPVYPSHALMDMDNPHVVLDFLRMTGGGDDTEAWQAFEALREGPCLWRSPEGQWETHGDTLARTLDTLIRQQSFEDCERMHRYCDAPARAVHALCTFTRALAGWCACNAQLRALGRHEETCIEWRHK